MAHSKESNWPGIDVNGRMIRTPEEFKSLSPEEAIIAFSILEERARLRLELGLEQSIKKQGVSLDDPAVAVFRGATKDMFEEFIALRRATEDLVFSKVSDPVEQVKIQIIGKKAGIGYLTEEMGNNSFSPDVTAFVNRRIMVLQANIYILENRPPGN